MSSFAQNDRPLRGEPRVEVPRPLPITMTVDAPREITVNAICRYCETRRELQMIMEGNPNHKLDPWEFAASLAVNSAEEALVATLLAWHTEDDPFAVDRAKTNLESRGYAYGGKLYLAVRGPDNSARIRERESDGCDAMRLAVVDLARIEGIKEGGPR